MGVTKQVVSNWERNVARPEINHLISLAEVFNGAFCLSFKEKI
ncbi:helix-turn-helix transcriptional regulator [Paenibacillus sp. Lou8.1]|nr:helix-turn-helix transcriptional regulator [Paenibacillus sp. Lou8.1]